MQDYIDMIDNEGLLNNNKKNSSSDSKEDSDNEGSPSEIKKGKSGVSSGTSSS